MEWTYHNFKWEVEIIGEPKMNVESKLDLYLINEASEYEKFFNAKLKK